jgi:phospholipid/cholesterol/gamma-HCH transport system ATP-binding protein
MSPPARPPISRGRIVASIYTIADRVIMLDKRTKGIIAEGDPKVLRDTSDNPWVRRFFRREVATEAA